jgi:hypothetical protein
MKSMEGLQNRSYCKTLEHCLLGTKISITPLATMDAVNFSATSSAISMGAFALAGALGLYAISRGLELWRAANKLKGSTLDFSNVQGLLDFDHTTAEPIAYRPWKAGKYNMTMGIRKMPEDEWLTIDKNYAYEQKFKEKLLGGDMDAVLQSLPEAKEACKETLECVVNFLIRRYPDQFKLLDNQPEYVYNAITRKTFRIVEPFEQHPLAIAAQLAMEDFNLLMRDSRGESQDYNL